ncbi:MAG: hypothetical protein ACRBCI_00635 [Cellvibrionaceae bacterium]
MKNFLTVIFIACANIATIAMLRYLKDEQELSDYLAIPFAAIVGLLVFKVLELLFFLLPLHYKFFRSKLDLRSFVEGEWIEYIPELSKNPYSLLLISYDKNTQNYQLTVRNFDLALNQARYITGGHVSISSVRDEVVYTYDSQQGNDMNGICYMHFQQNESGDYDRGEGYFFDRNIESKKYDFSLYKIERIKYESDKDVLQRKISELNFR